MKKIPYGRQNITDDDIRAVVDVLQSDFLTQGPKVQEFEKAFAGYVGARYAVAVSHGTAALHLCTLSLGVNEGDNVITTPISFVASANCVRYCGGNVVFADIDPENYLLDIGKVRELLERSPRGTFKGIIPVDLAGKPVDLEAYRELADEFGLWIIEDASHAPGGYFTDRNNNRQNCGNGKFADLSTFSFHPIKHITTGEGGMITTNNEQLYKKLKNLRTHGIQQNTNLHSHNDGTWYYEMQDLGFNFRLNDMQAALGLSQLKRADVKLDKRKRIAAIYENRLRGKSYVKKLPVPDEGHAYHLYIAEFDQRNELYYHLRKNNIYSQIHYIPIHLMPYYRQFGWKEGDFPNSERYYSRCLSLPVYSTLTDEEQEFVIRTIDDFYA